MGSMRSALVVVACLSVATGGARGAQVCPYFTSKIVAHAYRYFDCLLQNCEDDEVICASLNPTQCNGGVNSEVFPIPGVDNKRWTMSVMEFCPRMCQRCGAPKRLPQLCPDGWRFIHNACLRYFDGSEATGGLVSWDTARAACRAIDNETDLAILDTAGKNFVAQQLCRSGGAFGSCWIGLRQAGAVCNLSRQAWRWNGTGEDLGCNFFGYNRCSISDLDAPPPCYGPSLPSCAQVTTRWYWWLDNSCSGFEMGYLCSRPATLEAKGAGRCEDNGMVTIYDPVVCKEAGVAIGDSSGMLVVSNDPLSPEGCWIWYHPVARFHLLVVSIHPATRGFGVRYVAGVTIICAPQGFQAGGSGNATVATVQSEASASTHVYRARLPLGYEVAIPVTSAAYFLLLVVAVAYRRVLLAYLSAIYHTCARLLAVLPSPCRLLRRWRPPRGAGGAPLGDAGPDAAAADHPGADPKAGVGAQRAANLYPIAFHMRSRRRRFATGAALIALLFDIAEVTTAAFVGTPACQDADAQTATDIALVLITAARIFVGVVFLFMQQRRAPTATAHVALYATASFILQGAHAGVAGAQELLVGSREATELRWRLLIGICLDLSPMCVLQGLYAVACVLLFRWRIPAMQVILGSRARSALMVRRDCVRLVDRGRVLETLQVVRQWTTAGSFLAGSYYQATVSLLSEISYNMTSLSDFALSEMVILLVVLVCMALLHYLLLEEARAAQRLQSTQSLLDAVSAMLAGLCDAVVHLDGDLRISQPAQRFANLLHRNPAQYSTAALRHGLLDHLVDEDRPRLRKCISEEEGAVSQEGAGENVINVTFKDAFAVKVPCQVFHARFALEDGSISYVLGINEIGERDRGETGQLTGAVENGLRARAGAAASFLSVFREQPARRPSVTAAAAAAAATPVSEHRAEPGSASSSDAGSTASPAGDEDSSPGVERHTPIEQAKHIEVTLADGLIKASSGPAKRFLAENPRGKRLTDYLVESAPFEAWLHEQAMSLEHPWERTQVLDFTPVYVVVQPARGRMKAYEVHCKVMFPPRPFLNAQELPPVLPDDYWVGVRFEYERHLRGQDAHRYLARSRHWTGSGRGTAARTEPVAVPVRETLAATTIGVRASL